MFVKLNYIMEIDVMFTIHMVRVRVRVKRGLRLGLRLGLRFEKESLDS